MENSSKTLSVRWLYLAAGTATMLFAGIIYAWSILKAPLAEEFGWEASQLALNFTLTMCFFCLGGFFGSHMSGKLGVRLSIIIAGLLSGAGFILTSLSTGNVVILYLTYGVMAGLGIGIAYNVIISTVNSWFPDKQAFSSGCLLMGFGISTLLFGTVLDKMFQSAAFGWNKTYVVFGIGIAAVLVVSSFIIKRPGQDMVFPESKKKLSSNSENFEVRDYSPSQMLRRPTFWRAFICITFLVAVGNSVISFARDLAISVDATASLATTLVGVLSVCNGLGRVITGAVYDAYGRKITMVGANIIAIFAAGLILAAVNIHSLPLCIVGLCLTGLSYGSAPTVSSAFASSFYGRKYFATNYSIINFALMAASFIATACSGLLVSSGSYSAPFVLLLILALAALVLNLSIKRP